jgi:nucleoside-diphosphate-sugar epimerase
MDAGRVGMLSILFDFVNEGRKTWILGSGKVRHQCVYAPDVVDAILLTDKLDATQIYNIGSDDVSTIREMYDHIVNRSNSGAKTARAPLYPTLWLLQILNRLKLSPLGPYQFRMLTRNFEFDTSKIKRDLGWAPTLNNKEMLWKSFEFYKSNFDTINSGQLSANQSRVALKLIRVLKYFS